MDLFSSRSSILYQINHHNIITATVQEKLNASRDIPLRKRKLLSLSIEDVEPDQQLYLKYSRVSNHLIYQNLVYEQNLKYWSKINYSWFYRILYGVQILPFRVYDIFRRYQETGKLEWENPVKMISREIKEHIKAISRKSRENSEKLGQLIADMNAPSEATLQKVWDGNLEIDQMCPSWWHRNWMGVGLLVFFGPLYSIQLFRNRNKYFDWINDNLVGLATGFYRNWVVAPIEAMVNTIKADDNIISSAESLNSDLRSLERMITDYLAGEKNVDYEAIKQAIEVGDMTAMMQKYEQQIKSPFKNIVRGDLVRGLLIQLQKTKVDGDLAISGIDKLIKSQQLLLALVSLSPTVLILYQGYHYATRTSYVVNGKDIKISCVKNLNALNRLLGDDFISNGSLLIAIVNLKIEAKTIMKPELFELFEADLNGLVECRDGALLTKIYEFYLPGFQ